MGPEPGMWIQITCPVCKGYPWAGKNQVIMRRPLRTVGFTVERSIAWIEKETEEMLDDGGDTEAKSTEATG